VDAVTRTLRELAAQGLKKVHFSGGEVLTRTDFRPLLESLQDLDLQVNLTTNGTLLDKETARWLVDLRLHTVAFSLDDAVTKKHDEVRGVPGAWRRTMMGIDRLVERVQKKGRGPVVAVNTVVTRENVDRLDDLHDLLAARGVQAWRLLPVRTPLKKLRPRAEQWAALADRWPRWRPLLVRDLAAWRSAVQAREAARGRFGDQAAGGVICWAPWYSVFIDADSRVFSCCTGRNSMPSYGGLHQASVGEALESRERMEVLTSMASGHEFGVCRTCDEFLRENEEFVRGAAAPADGPVDEKNLLCGQEVGKGS
jgi:MoaA/NifB/PqqE/SkfB family radical SAM enzyme